MFPFNGMPAWAQDVGETIPLTHYIRATRDVLLRGEGPAVVWAHMLPVLAFTIAAFCVAIVCYRRRLD
jgi:ABC-2 type transport system permease protein